MFKLILALGLKKKQNSDVIQKEIKRHYENAEQKRLYQHPNFF